MSLSMFMNKTSLLLCIVIYVMVGMEAEGYFIFVITSFYNILKEPMTFQFPRAIALLLETQISMKRITKFLNKPAKMYKTSIPSGPTSVRITNGSTRWLKNLNEYTVTEINFVANPAEMTAIVGSVGSGKSTLLNVILQELALETGTLEVNGTISYSSQEPWLFTNTIRQNILFGSKYDSQKYEEVCRVCALNDDFKLLPAGDMTMVGENGVTLSGGQRARINLARSVYRDSDVYLLDDPLSAVDVKVSEEIFKNCFKKYLKGKTVILVTNDLRFLKDCDKIYLINKGRVEKSGTYEQLKESHIYFTNSLQEQTFNHQYQDFSKKDQQTTHGESSIFLETRNTGNIDLKDYFKYFSFGKSTFLIELASLLFITCQFLISLADYFSSLW